MPHNIQTYNKKSSKINNLLFEKDFFLCQKDHMYKFTSTKTLKKVNKLLLFFIIKTRTPQERTKDKNVQVYIKRSFLLSK